jgi:hypothetical protein
MTKEEFIQKTKADSDWAPGWEVIDNEFERLYPGQKPEHFGTVMTTRAMFGGDSYLDGCSIYTSSNGYKHLVTYGMTTLYADENALGGEYNGWGYEMTMKLREEQTQNCMWAIDMLLNLARYTYRSKRHFEPEQFIKGNGSSLHLGADSKITALITVSDTEAKTIDSLYGETGFVQIVGITEQELKKILDEHSNLQRLIERMKKDDPDLVTDMSRETSYI